MVISLYSKTVKFIYKYLTQVWKYLKHHLINLKRVKRTFLKVLSFYSVVKISISTKIEKSMNDQNIEMALKIVDPKCPSLKHDTLQFIFLAHLDQIKHIQF